MTPRARPVTALACAWVVVVAAALSGQLANLTVERQGDRLHLSAPQFHFLEGRPLEQLHDGAAVSLIFTVTIEPPLGGGRWVHLRLRFVVSYDLGEEKFSVVLEGPPRRTASHLTGAAAEAWCLDNLLPMVASIPADRTFVVKLQCSIVSDEEPQSAEDSTLSRLIDIFSRKGVAAPPRWELRSAPLRLADLKNKSRH